MNSKQHFYMLLYIILDKQSKFQENFNCLQMAMNLVKDKLLQYG